MKTFRLLPLLLLISVAGYTQQFKVSAKLSGIKQNGLHVFYLGPDFRLLADDDPEAIRIHDSAGKDVPYFFEYVADKLNKQNFTKYPILFKSVIGDTLTSVIIQNKANSRMQNITLAIANNDAIKTYSISGSNDKKEWFGLVNNEQLSGMYNPADTQVYKTLLMPQHTYKYIKIDFNDKNTLPLNITDVGIISTSVTPVPMQIAKPASITTQTIGKTTKITVRFNYETHLDNIGFDVKRPSFYKRDAKIYVTRRKNYKRKTKTYTDVIEYFELNSAEKNTFDLASFNQKQFVIEINNNDNPALDFSGITFYQKPLRVVADFKTGQEYTVVAGNKQLAAANYDLANFKDKLPPNLPEATLSNPTPIAPTVKNSKTISQSPLIMWGCISVGALIVFYFCYSLVTDIKNKPKEDL